MLKPMIVSCAILTAVAGIGAARAADHATAPEAVAMVKKAVAYIKANGTDKAYAAFDDRHGQFVDRDLYILVYRLDGVVLAHGANAKLIGKDLSDAQDVDGKFYVKERMEFGKTKPDFWQDYKFTDPMTKKIEAKTTYCERVDNSVVCAGIYKPQT
ncbi:MAG TPA: cache domain-containing protein [Stellaceae bacterium]|nr:cache domain-containing protein [Stellaceae bacterium]